MSALKWKLKILEELCSLKFCNSLFNSTLFFFFVAGQRAKKCWYCVLLLRNNISHTQRSLLVLRAQLPALLYDYCWHSAWSSDKHRFKIELFSDFVGIHAQLSVFCFFVVLCWLIWITLLTNSIIWTTSSQWGLRPFILFVILDTAAVMAV